MASRRHRATAQFPSCAGAVALFLFATVALQMQAAACLAYEPQVVTIEGRLDLKLYPGGPHYKSIEGGDMPEPTWILTPKEPLCLDAIPGDDWNLAQARIEYFQVLPRVTLTSDLKGRTVRVEGTLFRPRTGHLRSAIVLRATGIAQ